MIIFNILLALIGCFLLFRAGLIISQLRLQFGDTLKYTQGKFILPKGYEVDDFNPIGSSFIYNLIGGVVCILIAVIFHY